MKKREYPFFGYASSSKQYSFRRWELYLTIWDYFAGRPIAVALAESEFEAVCVLVSRGYSVRSCYYGLFAVAR